MSFVEISALTRELADLANARVDKIYQPNRKQVLVQMYHTVFKQITLKISLPDYITLSTYKLEVPENPTHFVMFLRKYLSNSRLKSVSQPPFERIVEFVFQKGTDKYILICELFSKGNIILADADYKVLIPMQAQTWKDRTIRAKEKYEYPPKEFDPGNLDFAAFKALMLGSERNQIVKSLATVLSFGGIYAEELCSISKIEKTTNPKDLSDDDYRILFKTVLDFIESLGEKELQPQMIFDDSHEPVDVQPFELEIYKGYEKKYFDDFFSALDEYFVQHIKTKKVSLKETDVDREIQKHELRLKNHQEYLDELKQKIAELKRRGDAIYQHLGEIQDIFHTIQQARDKRIEWQKIIDTINKGKTMGNKEALMIKEIVHSQGIIILNLEDGVEIDFTKSVTENANDWYGKSKKLEEKLSGVEAAIEEQESKLKELREQKQNIEAVVEEEAPKKIEKRDKKWYEKFHWFYTKEGKMVIAGRDATQNEILIKKHAETNDLVLHTEAPGSPFAVIKDGKTASESEKREAAIFTLCHSKAWQNNRITEVYAVSPEQVSKKAPAGEYIAHGGFMIYGKKEYVKDIELKLAVGLQLEPFSVISGPVDNVRLKAKYYAIIVPGDFSKDEISKQIKDYWLNVSREEHAEIVKSVSLEEIKEHAVQSSKIFGLVS